MADWAMRAMEVSATPGTEATAMARGLLTLMATMAVLVMPVTEVLAMQDMEDMPTARGLPTLRLTMVVLAMLVTGDTAMARGLLTLMATMAVLAMPVMEVLATPDMEDTHTASKCPKLSRELQPTELLNLNYKNFHCSDSTRFQNVNSLLAFINCAISGKYISIC